VNIEDYVALLAPLAWFFFMYTYLQKKNEKSLRENQKNIEEAYRYTEFYKDLFTHDIRNIIQNILLAENFIEQSNSEEDKIDKLPEIFALIKEQVLRGENLISNVTRLSEIRKSPVIIQTVDLKKILVKTVENIKNLYDHRNFIVQIPDQKLLVKANDFLEIIVENVLINSIIHNKNTPIKVWIKQSKYKNNQTNYIKIEFMDNGIGISDERKKEIFITREEEETKFRTGLGLSLIKKVIENYGGKIWVEDRIKGDYSKGSNFVLLIPEG
jgi:signal transduction histidine kinase